ncbi:YcxB family protein [uncultured Litoreibacter sp.]|uniref:YcxB family protein n=1 Tax=uncultured Litoreibacter sp. TaxID=1392394 RepID=UPI002636ABA5|nr:YcxB family protein [uncultured Litoreibacter sp.]
MSAITITYSLSEDAFMRAARALWSYRGIGDRGNWLLAIAAAAVGPVLLLNGFGTGWLFIATAVIFLALTALRNVLWRRAYRKMVKYTAPITATFTADTVETRSAEGHSTLPWTSFGQYAETPVFYFLFMGRRGLSIIPKSAFATDEELEQTRIWMTQLPRKKMRWT